MSTMSERTLLWTPRVLSIFFIIFLSLFALDVFEEHLGIWRTALALIRHLIPSIVLIAALLVAWRHEWIGSMLYATAGALYVIRTASEPRILPISMRFNRMLVIAGPAFAIAALFFLRWKMRKELRCI